MSTPDAKSCKIAENSSTWRLRVDSMPSKKPRVMVYLSEEDKKELDQWAKEETRTVNNLITRLIENALSEKRKRSNSQ